MNRVRTKEIDLNGRKLKLETGKLAMQADSSVVASWGETVVLATIVTQPQAEDKGYFPLSVEFVEKHYAGGRISSSRFIKRESRPSDEAVLTGRLIDRSVRPLFPKEFHDEVQVIVTVLSIDQTNDPDILGLIAASAALSISSVPWHGPLGVARIGEAEGKLMINPTIEELENSNMDLFVAATKEKTAWHDSMADQIKAELTTKYTEVLTPLIISGVFDKVAKEIMNDLVLGQKKRVDGRGMTDVRPIDIEVGILPRTHGSALFSRGDSQILSVVTLGAPSLGQTIEGMEGARIKS